MRPPTNRPCVNGLYILPYVEKRLFFEKMRGLCPVIRDISWQINLISNEQKNAPSCIELGAPQQTLFSLNQEIATNKKQDCRMLHIRTLLLLEGGLNHQSDPNNKSHDGIHTIANQAISLLLFGYFCRIFDTLHSPLFLTTSRHSYHIFHIYRHLLYFEILTVITHFHIPGISAQAYFSPPHIPIFCSSLTGTVCR